MNTTKQNKNYNIKNRLLLYNHQWILNEKIFVPYTTKIHIQE